MIELTRLNNQPLLVNADLIKLVEQAPDTVITLVTGEKLVVRENSKEVVQRVIEFRRLLMADLRNGPVVKPVADSEVADPDETS